MIFFAMAAKPTCKPCSPAMPHASRDCVADITHLQMDARVAIAMLVEMCPAASAPSDGTHLSISLIALHITHRVKAGTSQPRVWRLLPPTLCVAQIQM